METQGVICINCGATNTNEQSCKFCGSPLIHIEQNSVNVAVSDYKDDSDVLKELTTHLNDNLLLQKDTNYIDVIWTDIYSTILQNYDGYRIFLCRVGNNLVMRSGKIFFPTKFCDDKEHLMVYFCFSPEDDTSEELRLVRFQNLDVYKLFEEHISFYEDNQKLYEYAIDFGEDIEETAHFILKVIHDVYSIPYGEKIECHTTNSGEAKNCINPEENKISTNSKPRWVWWLVVMLAIIFALIYFIHIKTAETKSFLGETSSGLKKQEECTDKHISSNSDFLITTDGVGNVTFNSTIRELKKQFKNVKLEQRKSEDFGKHIWVELSNSSECEIGLCVYYNVHSNYDPAEIYCFIDKIIVYSPKYKTEDGVYVGQPRKEAEEKEAVRLEELGRIEAQRMGVYYDKDKVHSIRVMPYRAQHMETELFLGETTELKGINSSQTISDFLITENGIGEVTFNSTIRELKKQFKNVEIDKRYSGDYGERIWVKLSNGSECEILLILYFKDDTEDYCYIDEIATYSPKYKTKDGVYVGQPRKEIEAKGYKLVPRMDNESEHLILNKNSIIRVYFDESNNVYSISVNPCSTLVGDEIFLYYIRIEPNKSKYIKTESFLEEKFSETRESQSPNPIKTYDKITFLSKYDNKTGKYGYVDEKGVWLIEPQFDRADEFNGNVAWIGVGNANDKTVGLGKKLLFGIINKNGSFILQPIYTDMRPFKDKGVAVKNVQGEWSIIDYDGKTIKNYGNKVDYIGGCWYHSVHEKTNEGANYNWYEKNGLRGVLSPDGDFITEAIYEGLSFYGEGVDLYWAEGLLEVQKNGKSMFINMKGKEIITE